MHVVLSWKIGAWEIVDLNIRWGKLLHLIASQIEIYSAILQILTMNVMDALPLFFILQIYSVIIFQTV